MKMKVLVADHLYRQLDSSLLKLVGSCQIRSLGWINYPMPKRKSEGRSEEAIEFARDQRAAANGYYKQMWDLLRNKRCAGKKFRREHAIPPYTADFCCLEIKLTVEVDGEDHFTPEGLTRDKIRDRALAAKGFTVIRIPGFELMANPKATFDKIAKQIDKLRTG